LHGLHTVCRVRVHAAMDERVRSPGEAYDVDELLTGNAPLHPRTHVNAVPLQASVPIGVMSGYVVASVTQWLAGSSPDHYFLQPWRWPFLMQVRIGRILKISAHYCSNRFSFAYHLVFSCSSFRRSM
jgi:hypothetical protein